MHRSPRCGLHTESSEGNAKNKESFQILAKKKQSVPRKRIL